MNCLLDTHILLWALTGDRKLPERARKLIADERNEIYYSTASVWEVSIKHTLHSEIMPISGKALSDYCLKAGYRILAVRDDHVFMLETLRRAENAPKHTDPFDRIMLAQAKAENCVFLTHDSLIPYYEENCILHV
ncbi:MAG: type II toxin-antitoxin system VapC family toxin [Lachnospiraceae bacterium]|nr:type II toxin-antitoxin system VapC family toxin [Lachnospiraceae bacterium]